MEKGLLTLGEAANYLSCGRTKLFDLLRAGEVRVVKLGRATRVPRSELDGWIYSRTVALGSAPSVDHGDEQHEPSG
jgi:excisionase family DNA binding protein